MLHCCIVPPSLLRSGKGVVNKMLQLASQGGPWEAGGVIRKIGPDRIKNLSGQENKIRQKSVTDGKIKMSVLKKQ